MPDDPVPSTTDFSMTHAAAVGREQRERVRAEVRGRYREYLAGVFADRGVADAAELAGAAIDALFDWRSVATGDRCECGCHPRLSDGDLHDAGFGCGCTKTADEHRREWKQWQADSVAFWDSPEGQRIQQQRDAQEAELQEWLAAQPGVVVSRHGGVYPEQWEGSVDGHGFYFRERWGDWYLELDKRPAAQSRCGGAGVDDTGSAAAEDIEHAGGEVIAQGSVFAAGYGDTLTQRARFILGTIRVHLARRTCSHHGVEMAALHAVLGEQVRWCPSCGAHLGEGVTA